MPSSVRLDACHRVEPAVGDGGAQQFDDPVAVRVGRAQRG
jgi:hypothetical protein